MVKNTSIKQRLGLIILMPLIVLIALTGVRITNDVEQYQQLVRARQIVELATSAGYLIHSLQLERGSTVGYLRSNGAQFKTDMITARSKVDEKLGEYLKQMLKFGVDQSGEMKYAVDETHRSIKKAQELRSDIDKTTFPSTLIVIPTYTTSINALLDVIGTATKINNDPTTTRGLYNYNLLVQSNEAAGIERATSVRVYSNNTPISADEFHTILEKIQIQTAYINFFKLNASTSDVALIDSKLAGAPSAAINEYRKIMVSKWDKGDFNVMPAEWFRVATRKLDAMYETENQIAQHALTDITATIDNHVKHLIVYAILNLLMVVGTTIIAYFVARDISTSLQNITDTVEYMVDHSDFSKSVEKTGSTEIVRVSNALNNLLETLRKIISDVKTSSFKLSESAENLSISSYKVYDSAMKQAEATAEIASTVEEISASIGETTTNARIACDTAKKSSTDAINAITLLATATHNVHEVAQQIKETDIRTAQLDERSKKVDDIVFIIKEVADQTNLLALNAAMEAARVGKRGKGFAIIADEIKQLASGTAASSKDISELVHHMQTLASEVASSMKQAHTQTQNNLELTEKVETELNEQKDSSIRVVENINNIVHAVHEQNIAIQQIATNIEKVAQSSEHNKESIELNTNIATRLKELSQDLADLVGEFKV